MPLVFSSQLLVFRRREMGGLPIIRFLVNTLRQSVFAPLGHAIPTPKCPDGIARPFVRLMAENPVERQFGVLLYGGLDSGGTAVVAGRFDEIRAIPFDRARMGPRPTPPGKVRSASSEETFAGVPAATA